MPGAGAEHGSRSPDDLLAILAEARRAGFLGPGPLDIQLRHGEGFAAVAKGLAAAATATVSGSPPVPPPRVVDLGSGGGVPGLVVAEVWPEVELSLLEASGRRAAFLRRAVDRLGLGARVRVLEGRAEAIGRQPTWRGTFDGAMARSFGKPAVVAECAAPLLRPGAWLVVSEPPAGHGTSHERTPEVQARGAREPGGESVGRRWPAQGLGALGLEALGPVSAEFEYQTLRQTAPCPGRFPRRDGVPAKKPLF